MKKNKRVIGILCGVVCLLFIPLVAMQFSTEVNWTTRDFVVAGMLLLTAGLLIELVIRKVKSTILRVTFCAGIFVALFFVWVEFAVGIFDSKPQDELIIDMHNSRISVDWEGVYTGTIPCADCECINVKLMLNADETYELSYQYIGKDDTPHSVSGKFTWNDNGGVITLDCKNFPSHYKVGEEKLFQLDMKGNPITGKLADMYVLAKNQ
jgi:hypothetical protein